MLFTLKFRDITLRLDQVEVPDIVMKYYIIDLAVLTIIQTTHAKNRVVKNVKYHFIIFLIACTVSSCDVNSSKCKLIVAKNWRLSIMLTRHSMGEK